MSERLSMRKIREILRLKWELKCGNRTIATSVGVSSSTVSDCLKRAERAKLTWPLPVEGYNDEKLEKLLYLPVRNKTPENCVVDWTYVHSELKRKGVTLQLLWGEYQTQYAQGLSYSQYCRNYRVWREQLDMCMRQNYKAGEKMFVDYAGMTMPIVVDTASGEVQEAQIFVAVLGASNYTFAEATMSQSLPDWIASHVRAFDFFGGVSEILIPDNLKAGVTKPHRYEPDLNPTYCDMANHYGIAVIPTRVSAPRDKAKVEEAVQNVERFILAKLRNRTFFNLYELNEAIDALLIELNQKPFQKLPGSRLSQFEAMEKPVLKPLPQTAYVFAEWKKAKAGIDYHIVLDAHYYSVPYTLISKTLDVRYTNNTVEVFYQGKRVASHRRKYQKGGFTTVLEHMPKAHQEYAKWTPERLVRWALDSGKATASLVEKIIESRCHPQHGFRSCLGIMRLGDSFGKDRLENACKRALALGAYSYKNVFSILQNNLDLTPLSEPLQTHVTEQRHEYVRGGDYFA